jgi:membrane associated rhomboid family serine protease
VSQSPAAGESPHDGAPPPADGTPADPAVCYRHPDREAHIRCVRCERRICPDCMIPASVGFQCPECVREGNKSIRQARTVFGGRVTTDPGWVSKVLIGINVVAFVLQQSVSGFTTRFFEIGLGFDPIHNEVIGVADGEYYRLLTAAFLHENVVHIALNMYALYLFGPQVERDFGKTTLIVIYLVAGFAGNVAEYAFGPVISVGAGASGAIFGLLGAFLAYYYRRRHTAVGRFNVQWVWQILILNVVLTFAISGIGYLAHLGGFVAGIALGAAFDRGSVRQRSLPWAATVALVVLGIALVMWKTPQITSQLGL